LAENTAMKRSLKSLGHIKRLQRGTRNGLAPR
jgi:hypothetical protein